MTITINSLEELKGAVEKLLEFAAGRKKILFSGEIGAGKTTFIKAFCEFFNVEDNVSSPTYSLVNEYMYLDDQKQEAYIYHMDLYRLKSLQEALDIGIEEYLFDNNYCLIEWPELIEPILPDEVVRINLEVQKDSSRKMLFL